jgi:hypothetical protein
MIFTLSTTLHRFAQKHLCWHSITKILRNGPRAHFPFTLKDYGYKLSKSLSNVIMRVQSAWRIILLNTTALST